MSRVTALLVVLFLAFLSVHAQPLRKTDWIVLNSNATTDGYSYPRVASFKSGTYAIIFGYSAANNTSVTQLRVYAGPDKFSTYEAQYSTVTAGSAFVGPMTAQNVFVFPDGTAYGIWQMREGAVCMGMSFTPEAGLMSTDILYESAVGRWNSIDYLDITGLSKSYYALSHSGVTNISNFLVRSPSPNFNFDQSLGLDTTVIHLTSSSILGYPVFYAFIVHPSGLNGGYEITSTSAIGGTNTYRGIANDMVNAVPFVVDALEVVAGLFVRSNGTIQLLAFNSTTLQPLYQIDVARYADTKFAPSFNFMGSNGLLVAFSTTSNRINYQLVRLFRTTAILVGPQITHDAPSTTTSVSIANTTGSDFIVVAKDVTGSQIMSRTITFCGNGALDLNEECDGSINCNTDCKCAVGTVAGNSSWLSGVCNDQCNNGVVTGFEECDSGANCTNCKCDPGYQPMTPRAQGCQLIPKEFVPNVKPNLDCLDIKSFGLVLYFSFNNKDGFDQTIPPGKFNSLTPASLGTVPQFFPAGQSLTYPAWVFAALAPNDTNSITWILGQYNLTIDLTNPYLLECPKNLSVDLTLSTFGNLTDALVQRLLQNIASKYNISESRLSAEYSLLSTDAQGINTYVITITVSASDTSETQATDVVTTLLNDIHKSKEEVDSDLTKGLEEVNPVIKSVTPSIIESRGTSNPISVFTPTGTPVTGTEQMSGSSAVGIRLAVYLLVLALIM